MPGPYLASYYFTSLDSEGWSENFYIQEADIDTAGATAAGYIAPRMACSADNVDMVYGKVSDVEIKGDSQVFVPVGQHYPFIGTYTPTPAGCYLEANTALLLKIIAAPDKINRFFLRGLTLDVVTGRRFMNPTGFNTALTTLCTWIRTHVQVRNWDKISPPTAKVYVYTDATDCFFQRVTARKPGRPFGGPRGRKFAHRTASTLAERSSTSSERVTRPRPGLPPVQRP